MAFVHKAGVIVLGQKDPDMTLPLFRARRHWAISKGHMEEGETSVDAARREVLEETGLPAHLIERSLPPADFI